MGKTSIKIDCVDQRLFVSSGPVIASGGKNEDLVKFSFCQLWDGFEKYAVFYRSKNAVYRSAISDDQCVIPHEVLADEGWIYIGVFGVNGDVTRTSEVLKYHVTEGAITEGTKPSDPTPDIYAQFINRVAAVEERTSAVESFTIDPNTYEVIGKIVRMDNYEDMPLNCVTTITPKQSGSGEPSPDNIRAISGWTGAKLTRCGKNLINPELADGTVTKNGITFTNNGNGTYTVNGTATSDVQFVFGKNLPRMANIKFTCAPPEVTSAQGWTGIVVDNDYSHIIWSGSTGSISSDNNVAMLYCNKGNTFDNVLYKPMITDDPDAVYDDFTPFQGGVFTASFGQTVYGGTLDWSTGVLTVDRALTTLTGEETNINWVHNSGHKDGTWSSGDLWSLGFVQVEGYNTIAHIVCSHAPTRIPSELAISGGCGIGIGGNTLLFVNFGSQYNTSALLTNFLRSQNAAGTPVQVVYELATPTTIRLTPNDIYALAGVNNIWSDAGDTTVSGRKDILWLTSNLIKRLNACESAIISLGGNV